MPEYLAPGVYLEEASSGRGPIAAAATAVTAFVGVTAKGPLDTATTVGSFAQYRETFGDASPSVALSMAVLQFFTNGGRSAVIVRVGDTTIPGARSRLPDIAGDAATRTGIHALDKAPAAALLALPDAGTMTVRQHNRLFEAALSYCERRRLFCIVDPPRLRGGADPVEGLIEWASRPETPRHANAAVYFPPLSAGDLRGRRRPIVAPASGAVAGIYARNDLRRGVWKAPAGTDARVLGVAGPSTRLTDTQMARLQGASINPISIFPGRGVLLWGSRIFAPTGVDPEWVYVPVRRFALFIERSLREGLRWAVFEPNDESLWSQVRLSVSSFMHHLFRSGALQGASTREAYFVKCGRDTMTEDDIRNGRLNILVGFAPLKPAEFVIVRIGLATADSGTS